MKLSSLLQLAIAVGRGATAGRLPAIVTGNRDLAKASHATACAKRCSKNCKGRKDLESCVDGFVADRCTPFSARLRNRVKAKCLASLTCRSTGVSVCDKDLICVAPGQCCADGECSAGQRCLGNLCTAKGSPSFSLLWNGKGAPGKSCSETLRGGRNCLSYLSSPLM
jgi:hypothetical protein